MMSKLEVAMLGHVALETLTLRGRYIFGMNRRA